MTDPNGDTDKIPPVEVRVLFHCGMCEDVFESAMRADKVPDAKVYCIMKNHGPMNYRVLGPA